MDCDENPSASCRVSVGSQKRSCPRPSGTVLVALALLAVTSCLASWGVVQGFVLSYKDGWNGNWFTTVWVSGFALALCIQAALALCRPQLTTATPARLWVWELYSLWMLGCTVTLLVGLGIALPEQSAWAVLWLPGVAVLAVAALCHARDKGVRPQPPHSTAADPEAPDDGPEANKKQPVAAAAAAAATGRCCRCCAVGWRVHARRFWSFCGWSSIFWLSVLGFFLALQAAWLAADARAFPAPGRLIYIPIEGTPTTPRVHLACKGPPTPDLATIVMEGGGGSPGVAYDGIVEALAARGRRACWYDRLGYGWSSNLPKPTTSMLNTQVLRAVLEASGERAPFVLAGHSAGGQLALLFAATYPSLVAGVALLDSYDDVAIALQYTHSPNVTVTLTDGTVVTRPDVTRAAGAAAAACDVLRALTPLGWARFITMRPPVSALARERNAAYGNNKEWHSQWVEVTSQLAPGYMALSDQLAMRSGRPRFWQGTAWPHLGTKPVLLLPAKRTLDLPAGCDDLASNATCRALVASDDGNYYAQLYLAYQGSLGSNVTLAPLEGSHAVWDRADEVAAALLAKFAGV